MKRLTRRGFRAWLAAKKPRARVGQADSVCNCPLARYISRLSGKTAGVSVGCYRPDETADLLLCLPDWADAFVAEIDKRPGPVTARRALEILDGKP